MSLCMRSYLLLAASAAGLLAQTPPVTILEIDTENLVNYIDDVAEPSKIATSTARVDLPATFNTVFKWAVAVGDVVAINGKPAKGLYVVRWLPPRYTNVYTPGRAISDVAGNCVQDATVSVLLPDGTPVGTIVALGLGGKAPPPGAPAAATVHDLAVVGGTGAFLGMRGYHGVVRTVGSRTASMLEDPANRRINGGGTRRLVLQLIPMTWPEVLASPTGPAVYHGSDWSQVTQDKPARAGEWLIMAVSGLGPTKPSLDPGTPFPSYLQAVHMVNSPVEVTVNGRATETRNSIGWPTLTNVYRTDFLVPADATPGLADMVISAAWIKGSSVKIPVR